MQLLLHPSDRPVFRLRGVASQCRLELRLNDVPVHQETAGRAHHFDLAINEWLFQGGNVIEARLAPLEKGADFAAGAFLEMTLAHKTALEGHDSLHELGHQLWRPEPMSQGHDTRAQGVDTDTQRGTPATPPPPPEEEAALLALPGQAEDLHWLKGAAVLQSDRTVRLLSRLPLPPPWPVCPWLRGALLADMEDAAQTVGVCLRTLHAALRSDAWQPMLETRRAALQAAYGLAEAEVDEALGFPPLLRQPGWQLAPLPAEMPRLEIAGKGRLARMTVPATGMSPIVFTHAELGILAEVDAWWMFQGRWLLMR